MIGASPMDPVVYAGAAIFLAVIAALASLLPAFRAARMDPMSSLHHQ